MSSVYVLEPPTKGKVVITTTLGPLDIELWPKEAPKAVRSLIPFFALLDLCLSGIALLIMKKALVVNALIIARGGVYVQRVQY